MPKKEWGTKRVCPETGKRFYDLNASPVVSPYTGKVVEIDTGKTSRTMVADKADKATKAKIKADEDDDLVDDDDIVEDDPDVDLDDDVLEDDEDDDVSLDDIADVAAPDDD